MRLGAWVGGLVALALGMLSFLAPAEAQITVLSGGCGTATITQPLGYYTMNNTGQLCTSGSGGGGGGLSVQDGASFTAGTSNFTPSGCTFTAAGTLSAGTQGTVRCNGNRAFVVDVDTTNNNLYAALTAASAVNKNGTATGATGATPGTAQTGTQVNQDMGLNAVANTALGTPTNFGTTPGAVVVPGVNASLFYGTVAAVGDPCHTATKTTIPISITTATTTNILVGVSAKKTYVCHLFLTAAAADNVAVIQGTTGGTCGSGTLALLGATTAANSMNFAANGGVSLGNGESQILQTTVNNNDICIITSAGTPLAGSMTYVQQ